MLRVSGDSTREGWLRGGDLNPRPLGYEPNELPDCSTPRHVVSGTNRTANFPNGLSEPTGTFNCNTRLNCHSSEPPAHSTVVVS